MNTSKTDFSSIVHGKIEDFDLDQLDANDMYTGSQYTNSL